jgi:AhpC/TSA family
MYTHDSFAAKWPRWRSWMQGMTHPVTTIALLLMTAAAPAGDRSVEFRDGSDRPHTPLSQPEKNATVLFFLLTDCPISNTYAPEIKRICAEYESKKIAAFIVYPDPDVTVENAKKHTADYGFKCPTLRDPTHVLVKWAGATHAPQAVVLDPEGKVVYLGRIDNRYVDYGKPRPAPTERDLRKALDAVLAGKPVSPAKTKVIGCDLPEPKKK